MTVLLGRLDTKAKCDKVISEKMRALAKVRAKHSKAGTMHTKAAFAGEIDELQKDLKTLRAHQAKLKK